MLREYDGFSQARLRGEEGQKESTIGGSCIKLFYDVHAYATKMVGFLRSAMSALRTSLDYLSRQT